MVRHYRLCNSIYMNEAKAKLSSLTNRTLKGEEVLIAKRNKPLVRLVPLPEAGLPRRLGV